MINEEQDGDPSLTPVVEAGRNCWRIEKAARAAAVVDAADYYHYVREAMLAARRRILIIGWDFDTRIALEPDGNGRGESLGHFFLRLARENPARQIDILKWSFGALKQFLRPRAAWMLLRWQMTRAIDFRFDSFHPAGCSHHQKIVVIDERFAVCGGIDISCARWDTTAHADDDPRRTLPEDHDARHDEHQQDCGRGEPAERQPTFTHRLVQKVTDDGAQWSRQHKCCPEEKGSRNSRPQIACHDDGQQRAEHESGTSVAHPRRVGGPVSKGRTQCLGKHDRHPVEHL